MSVDTGALIKTLNSTCRNALDVAEQARKPADLSDCVRL
jgi:hypothetical protein